MTYPIIVTRMPEHEKHKSTLLSLINTMKYTIPKTKVRGDKKNDVSKGTYTDYFLPTKVEREYLDYFYPLTDTVMHTIAESLGFHPVDSPYNWEINTSWFQQYTEGGFHSWHNHPGGQFANSYFLELPEEKHKTEIIGIDGKVVEYTAEEGDIVTFPAWMKHRSPAIDSGRKTVIAFNSNYEVTTNTDNLFTKQGFEKITS
jgi:hypothetical protein